LRREKKIGTKKGKGRVLLFLRRGGGGGGALSRPLFEEKRPLMKGKRGKV